MFLFFYGYNNLVAGSKLIKGKPTKIQKENPIEVDNSDESSILSYLDNSDGDKKNGSDDDDEENDDDVDVGHMSDKEARQMFDDEVFFSSSSIIRLVSKIFFPSCPRLQIIQLRCSTMMMTLKSPVKSLIAASGGPAQKLHDHRHQNPKGCLMIEAIQAKRRLTMMTTSRRPLSTFPCLRF